MNVLIISGFLGAGKTTFIKELIRQTDRKFVVLENEYGSTDVDQQVLNSDSDADVWDLTEGCICCTKSADLNASVMTIESTLSPEFLIVEPSGIGALSNVIRNLQKIEYERITLLRPITIVDGESFERYYLEFADIYRDQLKTAGTVAISKPDRADEASYSAVRKVLDEINPNAEMLPCHYTQMPKEWWESLLATAYSGEKLETPEEAETDLETYTLNWCSVNSPVELLWILESAMAGRFGQVIRAKGILPYNRDWLKFDIAGGRAAISGMEEEAREGLKAECVWIGRGLDRFAIKDALHASYKTFIQVTDQLK